MSNGQRENGKMIKTYNILKKETDEQLKKYSNEELAVYYQNTRNESAVAEVYCRNINYWLKLNYQLKNMPNEDKVSIILEKIHTGMELYNITQNASLLTFIRACVFNVYGGIITKSRYKDRTAENVSLDAEISEDGFNLLEVVAADNCDLDTHILKLTINSDKTLTPKEKLFCNLVIDNPVIHLNEISEEMQVTTQCVWLLRKKLAKKLKVLFMY